MELLEKFRQNGYFTAELYHLLVKKKMVDETTDIIPSEYQNEMKISTEQRLQRLNNMELDNLIALNHKKKPILSFTPRLLVFQNFKANDKIVTKFSVKNIGKAPTYINMVFKESSYFFIKPCSEVLLSRLAPGISVSFYITFTPVQEEDYTHRVTFYTDVDQYILPLLAMGPRPVFDFPDKVDIPRTPLKIESGVAVPVLNTGIIPASFTLKAKCPFSVTPKSAYLKPKESIILEVKFKSMILGNAQGLLYAMFETGENFKIQLSSSTFTVSVELEKQVVRFFDTYNTMVRQQTFKVVNKSEHVLSYMCMKNECIYFGEKHIIVLETVNEHDVPKISVEKKL